MGAIQIDSVFLDFNGRKVLRGANLAFKENKVTGILGRNGCGKSCFLQIITGQLKPQSKHISYNDKQLFNLYKEKGLINYLPQHEFHPKSVRLNSLLYFYDIAAEYFFSTYPFLKKNNTDTFAHLSGGERRIIEVLLVLESKTKFSILDEPFSHIMPKYIELVKNRIKTLTQRKGILLTDHLYQNVLNIADDLYLLHDGVIKSVKDTEDLSFYGYIR